MNCEQAQDAILMSDDPAASAAGDSELARHAAACAGCQAFVARLVRVEQVAAKIPTPGSDAARRAVLDGPRMLQIPARRRFFLRPAWLTAAAALLLIGIGLTAYLWPTERPTSVVEQLIDWDLALADAPGPQERQQIYASLAPTMQSAVQSASLSDEDRKVATTLLENGAWLSRSADPVERAEKFCDLADILVGRMGSAAARNDALAVQRLGPRYGRLQQGLVAHLDRLRTAAGTIPPAQTKRLERIAKRTAEAEKRLQVLSERSDRASQKALRRTLEQSRKQGRRAAI